MIERSQLEAQNRAAETAWRTQHRSELADLADNLETAVGEVLEIVNSSAAALVSAADTLTGTADGTQRLSKAVAVASSQASSSIDRIAASTQELLASACEVRAEVDEASRVADDAAIDAQRTSERITNLSSATNSIAEMAQAIAAIAQQTNLLALNATIEAARAGEAGRGFSVVASEVKALATQTAQVTKEITSHIESVQIATRDSVSDIAEITATISFPMSQSRCPAWRWDNKPQHRRSQKARNKSQPARAMLPNNFGRQSWSHRDRLSIGSSPGGGA